ncbi:sigma factor-like helix-turn-helix DNA-binding protein [Halocalculus aciditolerans]|uniref:RNA polymerase sigma factor 70 region 4 type 2 domain-containing protein n=1 Tax=Halocalculus aciditolerans TaxID=1383812 RepID=A0A830F274_9EURY|nr:sigma-70 region 4 domain-containing protein [Halocalculus aciditolerans]GGL55285.1 hypothetical protein GCM10009039_11790 [Halocalculus aciditolerans]
MTQKSRFDLAVETFVESSDMTTSEAEVYICRYLEGLTVAETQDRLDKSEQTVYNQASRAKKKARLPEVSKIETHARVTPMEDEAVIIWFANQAKLQYRVREHEDGETTVYEETAAADDPHTIVESFDVSIDADELRETALESLAEYINEYQDDPEACRRDCTHVFEALTLYGA